MFPFFRRTNPTATRASAITSELAELRPFFSGLVVDEAPSGGYPNATSLQPYGLNAYHASMLLSPRSWATLRDLLDGSFANEPMIKTDKFYVIGVGGERTLAYREGAEFNGHAVVLICNNADFILQIQKAQLQPPLPSESFPGMDPQSIGSLQGSMEFWWNSYWLTFWIQLSDEERQRVLSLPHTSAEWQEFIELHMPDGQPANPK